MEQSIAHFASEDAPLSVGIVFDTSGSMGGKLQKSRQAVAQFSKTANPEDEFFLVQLQRHSRSWRWASPTTLKSCRTRLLFTQVQGKHRAARRRLPGLARDEEGPQSPQGHPHHFRRRRQQQPLHRERGQERGPRSGRAGLRYRNLRVRSGSRGRTPEELSGPSTLSEIANQTGGRVYTGGQSGRSARHGRQDRNRASEPVCPGLFAHQSGAGRKISPRQGKISTAARFAPTEGLLAARILCAVPITNSSSLYASPRAAPPEVD